MHSLQTAEQEFKEQISRTIERAIRDKIDLHHKEIVQVIDRCEAEFIEQGKASAMRFLRKTVSQKHAFFNADWAEEVLQPTNNIPGEITLPEEDFHLQTTPGDSSFTGFIKFLKRTRFKISKVYGSRSFSFKNLVVLRCTNHLHVISKWQKSVLAIYSNLLVQAKDELLNEIIEPDEDSKFQEILARQRNVVSNAYKLIQKELDEHLGRWEHNVLNDLKVAGTIEYRSTKFDDEVIHRKIKSLQVDTGEEVNTWKSLITVNGEQLQAALTLRNVHQIMEQYEQELTTRFGGQITDVIRPPVAKLEQTFSAANSKLNSTGTLSSKQLDEICEGVKEATHSIIQEEIVEPMLAVNDNRTLSVFLEEFASKVALVPDKIETRLTLIEDLRFTEHLPEYKLEEIEWQSMFRRILGDEYLSELLAEDLLPEQKLLEVVEDFYEVDQIIATNLSVAQDIEKNVDEKQLEIITKGIELAQRKLDEVSEAYGSIELELEQELINHQKQLIHRLHQLLLSQDASHMRLVDAQIKVRQSASNIRDKITIYWAKFVDRLELGRRFVALKIRAVNESFREYFGLMKVEHINVQKTNIATILHETDLKFKQLPYIYRRLFDYKRTAEEAFFIRCSPQFEIVARAYKLWKSGFPASIALLGEKGSGRTTMVKYITSEYFQPEKVEFINISKTVYREKAIVEEFCHQLKIQPKDTMEELVLVLNRRRKKSVVVIENLQNCFLRTVNGYDGVNALLYLMAETNHKVLWVCSCSRYGWNFLNVVLKIGDYFSHTVSVDSQPDENIEELIYRRQVASGYQLHFEPSEATAKSRAYKKLLDNPEKVQLYLRELFFERLNKMAEGNATVAMIYWIRCIQSIESALVEIKPTEFNGIEYLSELDAQTLFVLTAFVLHDVLNSDELAITMNTSVTNAETITSRLFSRGLLVETQFGYSLNELLYRQVVRLLISKNFINA